MDEANFEQLLKRSESDTLDFKSQGYSFSDQDSYESNVNRAKFAKDIISMANTPRDHTAFIVIGVEAKKNGDRILRGISEHEDDNTLQQKLESLVYPHPKFRYIEVSYQGQQFGVIEIPVDTPIQGPYLVTLKPKMAVGDILVDKTLYWRRNSKNSPASYEETRGIYEWFLNKSKGSIAYGEDTPSWQNLINTADISISGQRYILLVALDGGREELNLKNLAGVDWNFVVDFDGDSSGSESTTACINTLSQVRSVHQVTRGDALSGNLLVSTTWYYARGIAGREATKIGRKWSDWLKYYASDFKQKLSEIAKCSSDPVVIVALWNDLALLPHLTRCLDDATELLGDLVVKIIVTDHVSELSSVAENSEAVLVELSAGHFLDGIATLRSAKESKGKELILLPGKNGTQKEISLEDLSWISEDLEVVHLNSGLNAEPQRELRTEFLRGAPISWFDLNIHADVDRDLTASILKTARNDLRSRKSSRINLYHGPGAGGSTIAKRILWELHTQFPTVVLSHCRPKETIERISRIFHTTESPIFILREGGNIADKDSDELSDLLASRQIPSVFLQVFRRSDLPKISDRTFSVSSQLNDADAGRFAAVYSGAMPAKRAAIDALAFESSQSRTAFLFGLTAFNDKYEGLSSYVSNHLAGLPPLQKKILVFLSVVYVYGQQALSAQNFAGLLALPQSKIVDFRRALSPQALNLIIEERTGVWRPAHYLIGKEVLVQLLSENLPDPRAWKARLADVACDVADFCRTNNSLAPEQLKSTVDRTFFYRNDAELLGTVSAGERYFSEIVMQIPTPEGRLRVFKHIVSLFPEEPHYWAHLGRLYSLQMQRYGDAREALEKAVALESGDSLLHHMQGMVERSEAYHKMEVKEPLESVLESASAASIFFERARDINGDDAHKYISEVQLIIKVLDYAGRAAKTTPVLAASNSKNSWLRESFERAEAFLDVVRRMNANSHSNPYEERCRAELDTLYGSHEAALQRWQNLLDRHDAQGVYAPPIRRQLVWTYLARRDRKWQNLSVKELVRCVELLEENATEEPGFGENIRLWIQASRFLSNPPSLDDAIERVAYWKSIKGGVDAAYYLSVLYALQALEGSTLASDRHLRELEECRNLSRLRRTRKLSFEWLSNGDGLQQITRAEQLGEWSKTAGFWTDTDKLMRIEGSVSSIAGPQAGEIELPGGIKAFFVPALAGLDRGRSENARVTCILGFSYDGPRAWLVKAL
ncbi:RNA-binding domain-containing protein [Pseudomonas sp. R1-7]|uniref:RNA-binding domain-containing protein n=1 Tax=Pseudomonas sp. R1-7 TaxID=2817398 RepID=UPI003DA98E3E